MIRTRTRGLAAVVVTTVTTGFLPLVVAGPASAVPGCDAPNPPPRCGPLDPPPSASNPTGAIEQLSRVPAGLRIRGWARDPDLPSGPLDVALVVGSHPYTLRAALPRPDIDGVGFEFTTAVDDLAGQTQICGTVPNVGRGNDEGQLACREFDVEHAPAGHLDEVNSGTEQVYLRGWALDPDTAAPISVDLRLDGVPVATRVASANRSDVAAAHPGYGTNHGFDALLPHPANGDHTLCASALGVGPGAVRTEIGCLSWQERHHPPVAPAIGSLVPRQLVRDGGYQIQMYFKDNSVDEFAFQVDRQQAGSEFAPHATLSSYSGTGQRTEILGAVLPESRYCYRLTAVTGTGAVSTPSERCLDVPPLPPQAPSAPWASDVSTDSFWLEFMDNSADETAFLVEWGPAAASWKPTQSAIAPAHLGKGPASYRIGKLEPGRQYCAQVRSRAESPRRASLPSDLLCVQTSLPPPPAAPSAPDVTAVTRTLLTLNWTDNATNETGYLVQRHAFGQWLQEASLPANSTKYTVTRLNPGSTTCYRIVAVNAGGQGVSPETCGTTSRALGVRTVLLWNCESHGRAGTVYLWDFSTGAGWTRVADLPSSWSGGICSNSAPPSASVDLPDGHVVQLAAVIAGDLTCGTADPSNASCRRLETPALLGDGSGLIAKYIVG